MTDKVDKEEDLNDTFIIKVVTPTEERAQREDFQIAKQKEVDGLVRRNIWKKVHISTIPRNANIVSGRFALTLKNYGTLEEVPKVRYVSQGFNDSEKPYLAHDVTTLRPTSIREVLSVAPVLGMRLFTHDVTQAYIQSEEHFFTNVFLVPKERDRHLFGVTSDKALKLIKPLYGLCDSGDYWAQTIERHLCSDLGMIPCILDPSLFMRIDNGTLTGLPGNYVDDNLNAGNEKF